MRYHKTLIIMFGMLLLIVGSAAYSALLPGICWTSSLLAPSSMAPGTSISHTFALKHTGILTIPATTQLSIVAENAVAPFITITQPKFSPVFKQGNQITMPMTVLYPRCFSTLIDSQPDIGPRSPPLRRAFIFLAMKQLDKS